MKDVGVMEGRRWMEMGEEFGGETRECREGEMRNR